MADRNSTTSINSENYGEPVVEEATQGIKIVPKAFNQASSSAEAAKNARKKKAIEALAAAVARNVETSETSAKDTDTPETGGATK